MKIPRLVVLAVCLLLSRSLSAAGATGPGDHAVIPLWPAGAPGSEARKNEPEKIVGNSVSNIHFPTLTVYLSAPERATGCAVIVCPGGGHRNLVMQKEGYDIAQWLAQHGVSAFVLKNRLANDDATPAGTVQPYTVERDALADAQRALRVVRSRAAEWHLDPARVGIMGFSAGGEVAGLAAMHPDLGRAEAADPLDRLEARPAFQALIYPGQSQKILPTKGAPPAFLACGADDRPDISESLPKVYLLFKQAGVPVELHIYAAVGHGFGLRPGPAAGWPDRLLEFLTNQKLIPPPAP
jgi:endo-1,4-beta-xylanase